MYAFPKLEMSLDPKIRPEMRAPAGGPQPLRRKRVEPAPANRLPRRRTVLNLLLGFATAVLLIDAFAGEKGLMERLRARDVYEAAEAQLRMQRTENAQRREYVRRLREDPALIEGIAREELGFIRPGELLFIVRDVAPVSQR
jgi:cell division protein FtsB